MTLCFYFWGCVLLYSSVSLLPPTRVQSYMTPCTATFFLDVYLYILSKEWPSSVLRLYGPDCNCVTARKVPRLTLVFQDNRNDLWWDPG